MNSLKSFYINVLEFLRHSLLEIMLFLSSFSHGGGVLCGVGRDSHGKGQVVLWSSAHTPHTGDVSVLAKAHTDVSIERMRIAGFDDSR